MDAIDQLVGTSKTADRLNVCMDDFSLEIIQRRLAGESVYLHMAEALAFEARTPRFASSAFANVNIRAARGAIVRGFQHSIRFHAVGADHLHSRSPGRVYFKLRCAVEILSHVHNVNSRRRIGHGHRMNDLRHTHRLQHLRLHFQLC